MKAPVSSSWPVSDEPCRFREASGCVRGSWQEGEDGRRRESQFAPRSSKSLLAERRRNPISPSSHPPTSSRLFSFLFVCCLMLARTIPALRGVSNFYSSLVFLQKDRQPTSSSVLLFSSAPSNLYRRPNRLPSSSLNLFDYGEPPRLSTSVWN